MSKAGKTTTFFCAVLTFLTGAMFYAAPCAAQGQLPPAQPTADSLTVKAQHVVKFDFFSMLMGSFIMGYQRQLSPKMALEADLGYVGVFEKPTIENIGGLVMKVGAKLRFYPYYVENAYSGRWLKGSYIMPQFSYAAYSYDWIDDFNGDLRAQVRERLPAFMVYLGREWVSHGGAYLEAFFGAGIGWPVNTGEPDLYGTFFADTTDNEGAGLVIGFGAKIGAQIKRRR